jgi:WD40 repeat protein
VGLTGEVKIINLDSMSTTHTLATTLSQVRSLAFTPNGTRLPAASSSRGGVESQSTIETWDMNNLDAEHVGILPIDGTKELSSVALSPDGEQVLFSKESIEIVVTNLSTNEFWTRDFRNTNTVSFSPDGRHVTAGHQSWAGKIVTGQSLREWRGLDLSLRYSCKFQPGFLRVKAALKEPASWFRGSQDYMSRYHVSQNGC